MIAAPHGRTVRIPVGCALQPPEPPPLPRLRPAYRRHAQCRFPRPVASPTNLPQRAAHSRAEHGNAISLANDPTGRRNQHLRWHPLPPCTRPPQLIQETPARSLGNTPSPLFLHMSKVQPPQCASWLRVLVGIFWIHVKSSIRKSFNSSIWWRATVGVKYMCQAQYRASKMTRQQLKCSIERILWFTCVNLQN